MTRKYIMRVLSAYGLLALSFGLTAGNYCWINPYYDYCVAFGVNCISMAAVFAYMLYQDRKYNYYKKTDMVLSDEIVDVFGDIEETYQDNELLIPVIAKIGTAL